jgi:Amidohydrolase
LTEVARECPEVKIVLNHFGGPLRVGPYRRSEVFPGWRVDIKVLSACPNVYVKLGGLAMIVNAFNFHLTPLPRHRASWPMLGSPKSRPASRISASTAALAGPPSGIPPRARRSAAD